MSGGRLANRPAPADAKADEKGGKPPVTVRSQLEAVMPSLRQAVPTGITAERFLRIVLTELRVKPALEACRPSTVLGAVMTAAQLGLQFGPLGHAYLVPFKGECSLIVGYKGYIDLARRSNQLTSIIARAVHEHDEFAYEMGTDERLHHVRPPLGEPRGKAIGYYGVAKLRDGDTIHLVLDRPEVEAFRMRSMNRDGNNSPWVTDYDAMACKTVIRRMAPWLPLSVEAADAIARDEKVLHWNGEHVDVDDTEVEIADDPALESPETDATAADAPDGQPIETTATEGAPDDDRK